MLRPCSCNHSKAQGPTARYNDNIIPPNITFRSNHWIKLLCIIFHYYSTNPNPQHGESRRMVPQNKHVLGRHDQGLHELERSQGTEGSLSWLPVWPVWSRALGHTRKLFSLNNLATNKKCEKFHTWGRKGKIRSFSHTQKNAKMCFRPFRVI